MLASEFATFKSLLSHVNLLKDFKKYLPLRLGLTYNLCVKMIATILLPLNYLLHKIAFTIFFFLNLL